MKFLQAIIIFLIALLTPFDVCAREPQPLRVHFLNVGYADAILVQAPDDKYVLIDAGGSVLDQLTTMNVSELEAVILTHAHVNHYQGLDELLGKMTIHKVLVSTQQGSDDYTALLKRADQLGIEMSVLKEKEVLFLAPEIQITLFNHIIPDSNLNDNSSQAFIEDRQSALWLTSDIGLERQDFYLSAYPQLKQADIIQGPHHGDVLSEKMKQLFARKPMVISTGDNPYGLPNLELIDQWQGPVYRTDTNGHITLEADGESWNKIEVNR